LDATVDREAEWRTQRRVRILAAASALFLSRPFQAVQMDEVAKAASMGKATLYRYFPSKEALFLAIANEALQQLHERMTKAAAEPDPLARLRRMLETLVEALSGQLAALRLLTAEQSALEKRWRLLYREHRGRIVERLRETLAAGAAAGCLRPLDLEATPAILIGMIRGGLMGAPHVAPERLAAAVCEIALKGCMETSRDSDRGA
jgi:AcrR family transcriptional regulator